MSRYIPNPELPTKPPKKTPKRRPRRKKNINVDNADDVGDGYVTDQTDNPKKTNKSRRRQTTAIDYADYNAFTPSAKVRRFNGTVLANSRPLYRLKHGRGSCYQGLSFWMEYKKRLRRLLKKLIRRHNWVDAAGVLEVLLKATTSDKSSSHNRFKYWASMVIRKQIKGDTIATRKIQDIYDMWIMKPVSKTGVKERFVIQSENILFCLAHGDLKVARMTALGLMQERGFERDPISNLIVGLTFYQLWYSDLHEKWQIKNLNCIGGSMQSEFHEARSNSDGYDAVESQEDYFPIEVNSETSVANDKENTDVDSAQERVPMDVDDNLQTHSREQSVHDDSYVYSVEGSEDERSLSPHDGGLSIFQTPGLPTWLLPLEIPPINDNVDDDIYADGDLQNDDYKSAVKRHIQVHRDLQNDDYRSAVKHLQAALHSTPPTAEALHPLIQVLLIGDRVNEALSEIDNFVDDSGSALKLRLKVGFLEHFDRGNYLQFSSYYEEILEIDPTCSSSLVKLINMHQRGDYCTEKLVKMLALHLDATYADFNIWKDLASCLIKISQCAGDEMSIYANGNEEETNQSYTGHSYQIPELFTHRESGETWRFRCRWWLTRHFSSSTLASEIAAGKFQLLTYKAAVAAFLYGPGFRYVRKASETLEKGSTNQDMYFVLRNHVQNSVGIYKF